MKCFYLQKDGRCSGRYKGFACIGTKCRADKDPPCEHYDQGFYCRKFQRFGCVGQSRCGETVDTYLKVSREARPRANHRSG